MIRIGSGGSYKLIETYGEINNGCTRKVESKKEGVKCKQADG